jgi:CheY-like chemotaxis protein
MPRVLVIDDDDELRWLIARMLIAAGYEVQEATDGKAGLACYRQERSDVVLTDIVMPHSDGLETIRALRLTDSAVKIIAMSGGDRGLRSGDYGASRFLLKPFTLDELLTAVAEVLGDDAPR